ncbi:MAG: hypothetical protein ACR2IU_04805, partial [Candidatus Nanopelagicaceae bacterium]
MKKLIALIAAFLVIPLSPVQAVETRIIDIVSITWPGASAPSVTVNDVKTAIDNEVATRWNYLAQNWPGGINFQVGTVQTTPITMSVPLICEGSESSAYMRDARRAFYTKYPMADYSSHYLILLSPTPRPNCVWEGKSLIGDAKTPGGLVALKNNASAFVITHELGHTLGLGHTNLLRCPANGSDGAWSNCKAIEYGGAVDVMSNVDIKGPLSTYHQWRMGIINDSDVTQVWKTQTIDLKYTNAAFGTRAIFVRDGKQTYWIEFRKAADGYTPGLAIYRTDPPPASSVVSPNISDGVDAPTDAVTSDVWLMNLDTFKYTSNAFVTGSPTLQMGKVFLDSSGNISVTASQKDSETVSVTVSRKADVTPPPIPVLTNPNIWVSPESELITSGYEDADSVIDKFQISLDDKILDLAGSASSSWFATYLSPLSPIKSLHVKDLPEGTYSLKARGIDIYGNTSAWSQPVNVIIDRGAPVVTSDFKVSSVNSKGTKLIWTGVTDPGSGICSVQVFNSDGFVVARTDRSTNVKSAPELNFTGETIGKAQVFDCRGNGVYGEIAVAVSYLSASTAKSIGKVKTIGNDSVCTGPCSFSFSVSGDLEVKVSKGSGTAYINGVPIGNFKAGGESLKLPVGNVKKVVRIQGKDLVVQGLSKVAVQWKQTGTVQRKVAIVDPSLEDKDQLAISKYGFQISDFDQDYQLLPIARGTTLLDATLDLCSGDFPSEKSRVLRRQVAAYKSGSPYSFLSTETVKYKDVFAAESALTDLDKAMTSCKAAGGFKGADGSLTKYIFSDTPKFIFADGVKGRVILTLIGEGANARWLLGYFQIKGELAVNTYLVRSEKFTDADIKRWSQVASEISTRLSGYTPVN